MPRVETPLVCLASASPRRSALLAQIGVPHRVAPATLDERPRPGEVPAEYVARLAVDKAREVDSDPDRSGALPVLGADTSVIVDGRILGKPATAGELREMLELLAGRTHEVLTGVALASGGAVDVKLSRTLVRMRRLRAGEIDAYWASGEPKDKAGGYAIQGLAAVFIEHIEGSYSGVMGLPLCETAALLGAAGVPVWDRLPTREGR
jgi:septum formation protein